MATPVNVLYEFGPFQLDPPERLLLCGGQPVSLTPKAFDLLLTLVDRSGHLVEKEELLRLVWPGSFIEEGNLAVTISQVRKALNDDRGHHRYIETVSKRGYRFVAEVRRLDDDALVIASVNKPEAPPGMPPQLSIPPAQPTWWEGSRKKLFGMVLAALIAFLAFGLGLSHRRILAKSESATPMVGSLAVLPFQTLGTNSPDKFLELGMADAIITKLANTGRITVRPTSAIQQYAGTHLSPQEIGREQGVDAILDGRIQRDSDRVRLTVQLIRVRDGLQLWADTFDRKFTDVFALEDALADMAAQSVRLKLTGAETLKFTKRSTENPAAYEAYMKGRYFWNKRTDSGLKKGLDYFQQAIKLDPSFAEAYVGVADSYATLGLYAVLPPREAFPAAKEAGMRALQMDDGLAAAHATLGFINFYYDWNALVANNEFRRALEENPHYAMAHSWYGESLAAKGDYSEALAEAQTALQDDPLSMIVSSNAGWTFALAGQYDRAVEILKKAIDIDPAFPRTHFRLAELYEQRGQYALAIPEFEQAVQLSAGDPYYEGSLGHAYGASGNFAQARRVLQSLQSRAADQYVPPYAIALIHAGLGEKDQAFQWLQKAVGDRSTPMVFLRSDPELAGLRSDPRFALLTQLVNF
jgi:DNA-binding winged helix-turn-helix (wHTH) protein/TolB-like protein/lipoprotein NlpI